MASKCRWRSIPHRGVNGNHHIYSINASSATILKFSARHEKQPRTHQKMFPGSKLFCLLGLSKSEYEWLYSTAADLIWRRLTICAKSRARTLEPLGHPRSVYMKHWRIRNQAVKLSMPTIRFGKLQRRKREALSSLIRARLWALDKQFKEISECRERQLLSIVNATSSL